MVILKMFLSSNFILLLLLLCLLYVIYISVTKFLVLKKVKLNIPFFSIKIRGILKTKDITEAINYCSSERTAITNIIRRGLKKKKYGRSRIVEELESAAKYEINKLEKGLTSLIVFANLAPVLGFLGTIIGIYSSLMIIQESQSAVKFQDIAPGIWQTLTSTAFGIIVGLISTLFYNFLVIRIKRVALDMERVASDILDIMEESIDVATNEEIEV